MDHNIQKLINSPFETDKIKLIYFIVKNRRFDLFDVLKQLSENDKSNNVRFYALKAYEYLNEIKNNEVEQEIIEQEIKKDNNKENYKKILEFLHSELPKEKIIAIKTIVKLDIDILSDELIKIIEIEENSEIIIEFIKSVEKSLNPKYIDTLLKFLDYNDITIQVITIEALSKFKNNKAFQKIIVILYKSININESLVSAIIGYLSNFPIDEIYTYLDEMLSDQCDEIVNITLDLLYSFKSKKVIKSIEKCLKHKNNQISQKALEYINKLNESSNEELNFSTFIENLSNINNLNSQSVNQLNNREQKIDELRELIKNKDPLIEKKVNEIFKNETDPYVLGYAISACKLIPNLCNISILKKFLNHENSRIRANVIEVLSEIEDIDLHSIIKPFLSDENNRVRANAIIALKNYPDIDHVKLLKEMISDQSKPEWVISAIYAIMQIKGETIEILKDLVKSNNKEISERALSALEFLAKDSKNINAKNILNEIINEKKLNLNRSATHIFKSKTKTNKPKSETKSTLLSVSKPTLIVNIVNRLALLFKAFVNVTMIILFLFICWYIYQLTSNVRSNNLNNNDSNNYSLIQKIFTKAPEDIKITLLYTSNLYELIGDNVNSNVSQIKSNKLKELINFEKINSKNDSNLLLFDLGNYALNISSTDNTESIYKFLNDNEFTLATISARDVLFCFNYLSTLTDKFKLPVLCCNIIENSSKNIPSFFKTHIEKKYDHLLILISAITDYNLNKKLPSNLAANYLIDEKFSNLTNILNNYNNLNTNENNLIKILLISDFNDIANEIINKNLNFDIIITLGNNPQYSLLTNYKKINNTFIVPSKIKNNTSYLGKFEFIYRPSKKIIIDESIKWQLIEI